MSWYELILQQCGLRRVGLRHEMIVDDQDVAGVGTRFGLRPDCSVIAGLSVTPRGASSERASDTSCFHHNLFVDQPVLAAMADNQGLPIDIVV